MSRTTRLEPMARLAFALSVTGVLVAGLGAPPLAAQEAKVIELTQIPCQFVESENGIDRGYTTTKKADC